MAPRSSPYFVRHFDQLWAPFLISPTGYYNDCQIVSYLQTKLCTSTFCRPYSYKIKIHIQRHLYNPPQPKNSLSKNYQLKGNTSHRLPLRIPSRTRSIPNVSITRNHPRKYTFDGTDSKNLHYRRQFMWLIYSLTRQVASLDPTLPWKFLVCKQIDSLHYSDLQLCMCHLQAYCCLGNGGATYLPTFPSLNTKTKLLSEKYIGIPDEKRGKQFHKTWDIWTTFRGN